MNNYKKQFNASAKLKMITEKKKYTAGGFEGKPGTADDKPAVFLKKSDRDFVILNITDNHFSDYDIRFFMGLICGHTIKQLVKDVKPDLITVTGDMVCGKSSYNSIRRFTDVMDSCGVPWAPIFGNHDAEAGCDKNYLAEIMQKSPLCLLKKGDPEMGVGNYIININCEDGSTAETIFMMDRKENQPNDVQISWVLNHCRESRAREFSLMMHIPLPDYQTAYDCARDNEKNQWREEYRAFGENHEKICCERDKDGNPVFRGVFEKIKTEPRIRHVICGHEHLNDWSVLWQGVRLTYTLKVGMGSGFRKEFNGGTVITIDDNGIKSIVHRTKKCGKFVDIDGLKNVRS